MNIEQSPQPSKPKSDISAMEKKVVIRFSINVGKKIQKDFPEIATEYINGLTLPELVEKYDIQKRFGITKNSIARSAVSWALKGYQGKLANTYPGLITDPEIFRNIGEKHKEIGGKKTGNLMKNEGRGMFGMPIEEKKAVSARVGNDTFQRKVGIHTQGYKAPPLSFETRSTASKQALRNRGFHPFSEEEKNFMKNLNLNNEEYRTKDNKIDTKKIAQKLNERFHNKENIIKHKTVSKFFSTAKKRNTPML